MDPKKSPELFDQWVDQNKIYEKAKEEFLETYLTQVLYDLGWVTDTVE